MFGGYDFDCILDHWCLCNFGRRERGGGILLLIKEFGGSLIVLNHLEETNM